MPVSVKIKSFVGVVTEARVVGVEALVACIIVSESSLRFLFKESLVSFCLKSPSFLWKKGLETGNSSFLKSGIKHYSRRVRKIRWSVRSQASLLSNSLRMICLSITKAQNIFNLSSSFDFTERDNY